MSIPKPKRVKCQEALEKFRNRPCDACGKAAPSDPAHIFSVKSGGGDTDLNLLSLCRQDHSESHQIGWIRFVEKYPHLEEKLKEVLDRASRRLSRV